MDITKDETRFVSHIINALIYLKKEKMILSGDEYREAMGNMENIIKEKHEQKYQKICDLFTKDPHSNDYGKFDKMLIGICKSKIKSISLEQKTILTLPKKFISCIPPKKYLEITKPLHKITY